VSSFARRAAVPLVLVLALVALLSACTPLNNEEKVLFGSINRARTDASIKPVYEFEPLTAKARAWAAALAAQGSLAHSDLRALGVGWSVAAENVGRSSSVEDVVGRLLASPEHRANILNPRYGLVGVGAARAKDGTLYAVEVFIG
jgi:uncharacterized protein YkwD